MYYLNIRQLQFLKKLQLRMLKLILFIGGAFHSSLGNNITVSDCGRAEVIGLMDVQQPSYCDKTVVMVNPVIINYDLYVVQELHSVSTGDMCMPWRKEIKIAEYFIGSLTRSIL
jgi:hypothetical protein